MRDKGMIPDDVIAAVRERTDIVQVVQDYVQLKRSGVNYKGLCPFHQESTPSFNVNSARQFYHCFGCGESGDVFSFVMKLDGRTFTEVVEELAGRAGIEIERLSPAQEKAQAERRSHRQRALDLNRRVAALYERVLWGKQGEAAQRYLETRGIDPEVARRFRLGFAPDGGQLLVRALTSHNIPLDFGARLGLVSKRRGRSGHYDRFWSRLIFPLLSAQEEVLGFGGRLLASGDGPKYINTPETTLYHKGQALYGLHLAKKAIRQEDCALLVEGNIDVLRLHQYGFEHAVAPMGTALTSGQLSLIGRFSRNIIAMFDGDSAGRAAARKAIPLFIDSEIAARVVTLPPGEDPDSLLASEGSEGLSRRLSRAVPAIDFLLEELRGEQVDDSIPARAKTLERIAPVVAGLVSSVERDLYADKLVHALHIDRKTVERALAGQRVGRKGGVPFAEASRGEQDSRTHLAVDEREVDVLSLLIEHPHLFPRAEKMSVKAVLTNDEAGATYQAAMEMQHESGAIDTAKLLNQTHTDLREPIAEHLLAGNFKTLSDPKQALDDCVASLKRRTLRRKLAQIKTDMSAAEVAGDRDAIRSLGVRLIEVEREIHETR